MSSSIAMDVDTMMEPMVHITPLINSVNDCFTLFNKRAVTSTLSNNKSRFEQWSTTQRKESKQHHEETLVLPIIMTSQKPQRLEKLQELLQREQEEEQETTMSNITSEDEDDSGATSPVASPIHLSPSTEHARESSSKKQRGGFDETLEECEEKLSLHHVSNSIYKRDNGKLGEYFATTHPSSARGIVKNLPSPQEDIIRSSTTEQHRCECESSSLTTGSRMSTKAVSSSSSSFRKYHPYRRPSTQQQHDDTSSEEEKSKACCSSPCPCAPSSNPAESWIDEPSTRSSNGSGAHRHHYHNHHHHHGHEVTSSSNSRGHCHDYHSHYNSHRHTAPQTSSSYHQCAPYHSGSKSSYPMSHDHRFDHHYPFNNRYHHHHEYDHHQAMTRPHFFNCCMPGSNIQVPSSPHHHHHHSSPYCPPISTESHMMMNVSSKRRKQLLPPVHVNSQPSSRSPSPNCSTSCPSTPSSPCSSVSDDDVAMETTPIVRNNNRQGSSRSKNSNSKKYNKGDWTDDEHARFLKGYEECGCQWKLIAEHYVKTRDRRQTSSHAQNFLKKLKQQQQESKTNNK